MKTYMIMVLFLVLFVGCSTTTPPVTEYKLALNESSIAIDAKSCRDKTIKISQAFSSNSLMSLDMNYVQDEQKIYSYTQAKWENTPNQTITAEIAKAIRGSNLFKSTLNSKSRASSEFILEIAIEEFMQYYTDNLAKLSSRVEISFSLIDTSINKTVASKTFKVDKQSGSLDATGGVKALNIALEDVIAQLIGYMNEECR